MAVKVAEGFEQFTVMSFPAFADGEEKVLTDTVPFKSALIAEQFASLSALIEYVPVVAPLIINVFDACLTMVVGTVPFVYVKLYGAVPTRFMLIFGGVEPTQ